MSMESAVTYEPDVIERFAERLEARARMLVRGATAAGGGFGALVGSIPLSPLGAAWPIPHVFGVATVLAGLLAGGLIGYVVGSGRAQLHRLHAQTVLCQLHAQRATLAIWKLLRERGAPQAPPLAAVAPPVEPSRFASIATLSVPPASGSEL
jgi:hypothetical protein